jgi:diguanylate cyclase (GGDEF)-like protein
MLEVTQSILEADDLPSPPGVALKLLELYAKPDFDISEMAEIIRADPALTVKLIGYCNSPILGLDSKTETVDRAIVVIGTRAVKILALSFSLVRNKPKKQTNSFDYDDFWNRSLANAVMAKSFCANQGRDGNGEFLLGLMLDIGKVGLGHAFPDQFAELEARSLATQTSLAELVREHWGANHYQIGAELLRNWNFPSYIVEGVDAFGLYVDAVAEDSGLQPAGLVEQNCVLTQRAVSMLFADQLQEDVVHATRQLAMDWFGWSEEKFSYAFDEATVSWEEFAQILNFDASKSQSFEQLERRAMKGIAKLSMGIHNENVAINEENEQLRVNAMVDSLTGLKNRRAYDQDAAAEWERSVRLNSPLVLMIVDIDHFKKVNDVYGHAVGDSTLVAVGQALRDTVRQYDTVYRFGGEEFVIIVPSCEAAFAVNAAERYRRAIEGLRIPLDSGELKITASFGVSALVGDAVSSLEQLFEEADTQLYAAKKSGRNRVCVSRGMSTVP